jgi:hypothetical protein
MIRLSGRITPRVIASRSSATFLPEKSRDRAAEAALSPVLRACFCAVCCRPRALPPAFAARLRVVVDVDEELLDLRADDVELDEARLRVPVELVLRAAGLRAAGLRADAVPLERVLRDPEPLLERDDLLRDEPPPPDEDDRLRDEPPPLPLPDSAMILLL